MSVFRSKFKNHLVLGRFCFTCEIKNILSHATFLLKKDTETFFLSSKMSPEKLFFTPVKTKKVPRVLFGSITDITGCCCKCSSVLVFLIIDDQCRLWSNHLNRPVTIRLMIKRFRGVQVPDVSSSVSPVLPTLSVLRLSFNRLTVLSGGAFSACPGLTELYLDNNAINSLRDNTFSGLSKLEVSVPAGVSLSVFLRKWSEYDERATLLWGETFRSWSITEHR